MSYSKRRTLLVAIDAACWEYLDPLLAQGRLPTIKRLMDSGVHGTLDSPMPPLTPVAWSSIGTGKGPAKHGVYEWVRRKVDGYKFVPLTASHRLGTPFWDRLAEHGIKVGLVNVPLTYPPPKVHGFVVCGFGTPGSAQEFTYPAELKDEIAAWCGPYRPAGPGEPKSDGDVDDFLEADRGLQRQQVGIAVAAAERYDVDVLVINLMVLDHANHFLSHMHHVQDAIVCTDSHLERLLEGFRPDSVLLISDHGSRRIHGRFLLGAWLNDHGYHTWPARRQMMRGYVNWLLLQVLPRRPDGPSAFERLARRLAVEAWLRAPSSVANLFWRALGKRLPLQSHHYWASPRIDPQTSKVYVGAVYGCLYLNVRGREPDGLVSPERRGQVLMQLASELSEITDPDTGRALFSHIYQCEHLYSNTAVGRPPDLVLDHCSSHWGLSLQMPPPVAKRDGYYVRSIDAWYGEHSREGIFVFAGKDIASDPNRRSASLLDVPATLLHLYDVPIPDDYDGQVLIELLEPAFLSACPVRFRPGDIVGMPQNISEYSIGEAEEILARLRGLGYVE